MRTWLVLAFFCHALTCSAEVPDALSVLYKEAAAAINARRWDEGLALQAELVRRVEALRAGTPLPEQRRTLFATWVGRYREHAAVLALVGRHDEAFRIAELTKARTLLELSTARRALVSGLLPAAERQHEMSEVRTPGAAEARALLPAGSVYLSYLVQDNVLMLLLLGERGLHTYLPPPMPNLARTAAAFRYLLTVPAEAREARPDLPKVWRRRDGSYEIAAGAPEPGAAATDDTDELADYLGGKLLGPAAAELKGAARIIISPDGSLAMLPFEALRLGKRYLIEQHEVQYTQSMGMYALSRTRAADYARLPGRLDLFAVGGALYEQFVQVTPLVNVHVSLLLPPVPGEPPARHNDAGLPQAFKSRNIDWRNLPASEVEVDEAARLFDPARTRLLKGAEATEERLWRLNASGELAKYRYLLFATHGYASSAEPALSSVVLGQIGNRSGFDGYVTAAEWPLYDLRSDLVVVSACSSGLGYIVQGEGLMGLPFALHLAGNRNTLLTLWTVHDLSTADFVVQFFHHLRSGTDQATALALAKRSFIADTRRRNPYFWAPFVLYGS